MSAPGRYQALVPARRTEARPVSAVARCIAAGLAGSLGGCGVLSPVPAWELLKAGASASVVAASQQAPARAQRTVHHGDAPVTAVCIEFNQNVVLEDLVPALQRELRAQGVQSRVYDAGILPPQCLNRLRYTASVDWAVPPLASTYQPTLATATLSLHGGDGSLMAISSYAPQALLGAGRWATTQQKLAPVVKALITGFES